MPNDHPSILNTSTARTKDRHKNTDRLKVQTLPWHKCLPRCEDREGVVAVGGVPESRLCTGKLPELGLCGECGGIGSANVNVFEFCAHETDIQVSH